MSLRDQLNDALKQAMRERDTTAVSTVRLILAALKDRDICARGKGQDPISDDEILGMLQSMVKQRRDSIALYEQGARLELAEQEQAEIRIIERFLPRQMTEEEMKSAVDTTIGDIEAQGIKDMGRLMGALKERYAGQMDFAKASAIAKQQLNA